MPPCRSGGPPVIASAALIGGTHGNELTGITVVRRLKAGLGPLAAGPAAANLKLIIANPRAVQMCRRYVDRDLNRCFMLSDLTADPAADGEAASRAAADPAAPLNNRLTEYEHQRARLIDGLLGPKASASRNIDLAVDLHTTTSNLGTTLIIREDDRTALRIAALAAADIPEVRILTYTVDEGSGGEVGVGVGSAAEPGDYPFLVESAAHGITVEIGPVAQGVLRASALETTERLVAGIFAGVDALNTRSPEALAPRSVTVYRFIADVDYPRDTSGALLACIHPDFQDRDLEPLKTGQPLFLHFDGQVTSHAGEEGLFPAFVNEAAYYEKGVAFSLTRSCTIRLEKYV